MKHKTRSEVIRTKIHIASYRNIIIIAALSYYVRAFGGKLDLLGFSTPLTLFWARTNGI